MTDLFFERPILNSPYDYPARHWELDEIGQPTDRILDSRRRSRLITPVPRPKKRKKSKDQIEMVLDAGGAEPLNLIVEIKGYRGEDAKEKANAMRAYWVPGVNSLGRFGRWAFAEFTEVFEIDAAFAALVDESIRAAATGGAAGLAGAGDTTPGMDDIPRRQGEVAE